MNVVPELDPARITELRRSGKPLIYGDASNANILSQADLKRAKTLVVTFPDPPAVINTIKTALDINPDLNIVARVHRAKEAERLRSMGVTELLSPEYEASLELLERTLAMSGWKKTEIRRTMPLVAQDHDLVEFGDDNEA